MIERVVAFAFSPKGRYSQSGAVRFERDRPDTLLRSAWAKFVWLREAGDHHSQSVGLRKHAQEWV